MLYILLVIAILGIISILIGSLTKKNSLITAGLIAAVISGMFYFAFSL